MEGKVYHKSDEASIIVCRCEDVTLDEVRYWIEKGYRTLEDLRRVLRLGMGPCQGRTCIPIVQRELAKATGKSLDEIGSPTGRPLSVAVEFSSFLK